VTKWLHLPKGVFTQSYFWLFNLVDWKRDESVFQIHFASVQLMYLVHCAFTELARSRPEVECYNKVTCDLSGVQYS